MVWMWVCFLFGGFYLCIASRRHHLHAWNGTKKKYKKFIQFNESEWASRMVLQSLFLRIGVPSSMSSGFRFDPSSSRIIGKTEKKNIFNENTSITYLVNVSSIALWLEINRSPESSSSLTINVQFQWCFLHAMLHQFVRGPANKCFAVVLSRGREIHRRRRRISIFWHLRQLCRIFFFIVNLCCLYHGRAMSCLEERSHSG